MLHTRPLSAQALGIPQGEVPLQTLRHAAQPAERRGIQVTLDPLHGGFQCSSLSLPLPRRSCNTMMQRVRWASPLSVSVSCVVTVGLRLHAMELTCRSLRDLKEPLYWPAELQFAVCRSRPSCAGAPCELAATYHL